MARWRLRHRLGDGGEHLPRVSFADTALQEEGTYYGSAARKMYVDGLVASLTKWWAPAEQISPRSGG